MGRCSSDGFSSVACHCVALGHWGVSWWCLPYIVTLWLVVRQGPLSLRICNSVSGPTGSQEILVLSLKLIHDITSGWNIIRCDHYMQDFMFVLNWFLGTHSKQPPHALKSSSFNASISNSSSLKDCVVALYLKIWFRANNRSRLERSCDMLVQYTENIHIVGHPSIIQKIFT